VGLWLHIGSVSLGTGHTSELGFSHLPCAHEWAGGGMWYVEEAIEPRQLANVRIVVATGRTRLKSTSMFRQQRRVLVGP
jgi:hypothetical protein